MKNNRFLPHHFIKHCDFAKHTNPYFLLIMLLKNTVLLTSLTQITNAGLSRIQQQLDAQINSTVNQISYRTTSDILAPFFMAFVSGYGCWCHFEDEGLPLHHGKPLDWWDEKCRELAHGYKCGLNEVIGCTPWEADYQVGTGSGEANLVQNCEINNAGNECAKLACKVEGQFVQS